MTSWYLVVDADYPAGLIRLYPAAEGGLEVTFPHQTDNTQLEGNMLWRRGHPCLETPWNVFDREMYDTEPRDAASRLAWHVQRGLTWLHAAAKDELTPDGDPYELPPLPRGGAAGRLLAYTEDGTSLQTWLSRPARAGLVQVADVPELRGAQFVRGFGQTYRPIWGNALQGVTAERQGVWLRLDRAPIIPPWQLPLTWGELQLAVRRQGLDLFALLCSHFEVLRDGQTHLLLLGWPMPENHGGPLQQMHWQALELPLLSRGNKVPNGWRPDALGRLMRDRHSKLSDTALVNWVRSKNWNAEELGSRGCFPDPVRGGRIAIIGVGALGSALAEVLARGGATSLILVDGELLEAGNLVRHSLTLNDLGQFKAERLARRLNISGPHAKVQAINQNFSCHNEEVVAALRECDVIVDCTASDSLLSELHRVRWRESQAFVSLSLGLRAQRLYCFYAAGPIFPLEDFLDLVGEAVEGDLVRFPANEIPREGIGCWHPVFPARQDDVTLFAAAGVKYIEAALLGRLEPLQLEIYEQFEQGSLFGGIRRLDGQRYE
ncbi:ThiF family adenylyltransferase [Deinococcus sp. QL22]|uniref:ThiF family adenylyltransferase n=1 Tax=Deinococcus sp. QL22 TaxID=2939437 RepID=UPI002016B925|nr:ThiF family adenylyltransferase [Deinococcus sp. QL22]UQN10197.1 ThiF family adenylyltransferase [Deinococcus sp. QL22]